MSSSQYWKVPYLFQFWVFISTNKAATCQFTRCVEIEKYKAGLHVVKQRGQGRFKIGTFPLITLLRITHHTMH